MFIVCVLCILIVRVSPKRLTGDIYPWKLRGRGSTVVRTLSGNILAKERCWCLFLEIVIPFGNHSLKKTGLFVIFIWDLCLIFLLTLGRTGGGGWHPRKGFSKF